MRNAGKVDAENCPRLKKVLLFITLWVRRIFCNRSLGKYRHGWTCQPITHLQHICQVTVVYWRGHWWFLRGFLNQLCFRFLRRFGKVYIMRAILKLYDFYKASTCISRQLTDLTLKLQFSTKLFLQSLKCTAIFVLSPCELVFLSSIIEGHGFLPE